MNAITVPAGFVADFDLYCERSRMDRRDSIAMRDIVRADYASWAPIIRRAAAVYRFVDATWGRMPTAAQCESYMASLRHFPDPTAFTHCGIGLLIEKCAELAGVIEPIDYQE
jgi:hypothetical protein